MLITVLLMVAFMAGCYGNLWIRMKGPIELLLLLRLLTARHASENIVIHIPCCRMGAMVRL
jgi:hypothetical protein